jgi:uncharacterized repeat protein (TIGR02543 family)
MSSITNYYRTNYNSTAFTGETTTNTTTANNWSLYSYVLRETIFPATTTNITLYYYNRGTLLDTLTQSRSGTYTRIYNMIYTNINAIDIGTFIGKQLGNTYIYSSLIFTLKTYSLTGYNLSWNTEQDFSGTTYNFNELYTVSDLTGYLFLNKTANTYTVSWNTNGGSTNPQDSTATYAAPLTIPATPTKTGYTFTGWYDGTTTYTTTFTYNYASAKTFTAQWTVNTYTASWSTNGGSTNPQDSTATYDASLTIPTTAPTKTGYTFAGWYDGTKTYTTTFTYNYALNKTFTAQWTANTYTASWETNGGSTNPQDSTATYDASLIIPATPTKTGYTFTGWYDGTKTYTTTFTYNYASAKTFTAQWTVNTYTASWSTNGGSTNPQDSSATYAASLTIPTTAPTKTGYTFAGWYDGTKTYTTTFTYNYALNKTFTAQWTANTYTASWETNGGSPATLSTSTATYDASLIIPAAPTKTGYTFAGWYDGTTTYTNIFYYNYALNKTFTAQWTVNTYTASWNTNGGSTNPQDSSATYAAPLTIPTAPTKTGYTFAGWYDGTTTYTNIFYYNYASAKTFTAQWTANTYTASYVKDGGTTSYDPTPATYNAFFTLPIITKTNYTFNGWYTTSTFSGTQYTTSSFTWTLTENTTFYAKFTINTLTYNSNNIGTGKVITVIDGTTTTLLTLKAVGYTFTGWYTNQATTQPASQLTSPYTIPNANTILYAKWTDNTRIAISDLLNTYGNINVANTKTSLSEYQNILGITASTRTSFNNNLKGKGPIPS